MTPASLSSLRKLSEEADSDLNTIDFDYTRNHDFAVTLIDWFRANEKALADMEKDAAIVLFARALAPFLEEGWDEQDDPADIEAAEKAISRLVDAVRKRDAELSKGSNHDA